MSPEGLFSSLFSVSLVFSLEQNSKNVIFHPIFLTLFSNFLVFTPTKHILKVGNLFPDTVEKMSITLGWITTEITYKFTNPIYYCLMC